MPEIIKGNVPIKGTSFLDSILSKETFSELDKHAHTLDQVSGLMDKANTLMSNPLFEKITDIVQQSSIGKSTVPQDPWQQPTMSELVGQGVHPRPMAQLQPNTTLEQPQVHRTTSEQPKERSELHSQVKAEIDKLPEDKLMDLLMKMSADPEIKKKVEEEMNKDESKPESTEHKSK